MINEQTIHQRDNGKNFLDIFLLCCGILSAGFGLKGFLIPNHFLDGGVVGISLITTELTGISLSILVLLINIPFIIMGYHQVSKRFALKTFICIAGLSLVLAFIDYPIITNDKVLIAVFGGFFLGAGVGLSIRGGGVIDGTEVLALYISRRTPFTIGDIILVINIIIFGSAAVLFGIEVALYSVLTYIAASRTVDFIVQGIEEYTGVTIVSRHSDEILQAISENLGRGVTVYKGKSGFGKRGHTEDVEVIFSVVTRLEVEKLKAVVTEIDSEAFIALHSINDTVGGMVKKRPLH